MYGQQQLSTFIHVVDVIIEDQEMDVVTLKRILKIIT